MNSLERLEEQIKEDRKSQTYQKACFEMAMSETFCKRLIELGYGRKTGEFEGEDFIQVGIKDIPKIKGVDKKAIKAFMEGNFSKITAEELFMILWEAKIILEPTEYKGQGLYNKDYDFSIKEKELKNE